MAELYCKYLNNSICFNEDKILYCTIGNDKKNKKLPVIASSFDGDIKAFEKILQQIQECKENLKNNIAPETCRDCYQLRERTWEDFCSDNPMELQYILFSNWYKCNSRCMYCQKPYDENDNMIDPLKTPVYNIIPLIKKMIEEKMITENTIIDFAGAGGEPTIYEHFDKAIEILYKTPVRKLVVHTNAINYNKNIEKCIEKGIMDISVSIDAGTREVHEKIKQVKTFDKVWKNIQNYAKVKSNLSDNLIISKYIIIPYYNDSEREIYEWVQKSKEAGVSKLILNTDDRLFQNNKKDDEVLMKIVRLTEYFAKLAKENHLFYELHYGIYLTYQHLLFEDYPQYKPAKNSL